MYLVFVAFLFAFQNVTAYLYASALMGIIFLRLPWKSVKSGWLPISIFLLFTFLSNVAGQQGRVMFSSAFLIVTDEGVHIATVRTVRVLLMIGGAKILMATASAEDMVAGMGRLLRPLEKVGIPVRDFFQTMGLTIKCLPMLKTMASEAYRNNVSSTEVRGFQSRVRLVSAFLLPLFVRSVQSPESFFEDRQTDRSVGDANTPQG